MPTDASPSAENQTPASPPPPSSPIPYLRLSITGLFMGLANLVPGVSGGTMVLALGLYEEFIGAFSDLTRLKFSRRALIVTGMLFGISILTIFGLAGIIQFLMEGFLPGMLALFIGMTLGGVPTLAREMRPLTSAGTISACAAFAVMAVIAFVLRPDTSDPSWIYFFAGGVVGSAAMILPGISGGYMLLIMGLYLPIIAAISEFKDALKMRDMTMAFDVGLHVILPVGLGVLAGLVVLSNFLKYLLRRHHRRTIGFLMGLLLGSVLGLYPFREDTLDKLPRYAVENELRVIGVGWKAGVKDSPVWRNLEALETDEMKLKIVKCVEKIDAADVEEARDKEAIIVAYDTDVPKDIRRLAAGQGDGGGKLDKVKLQIVPNTEFSLLKLALALALIVAGFFTTFFLGKLGGEKPKKSQP